MDAKGVNYTVFSNACASQGQRLPTYDELCPKGPGHVPFGWTGKDKDMWTPVMEHYDMKTHTKNKWVQIGSKPDWAKKRDSAKRGSEKSNSAKRGSAKCGSPKQVLGETGLGETRAC